MLASREARGGVRQGIAVIAGLLFTGCASAGAAPDCSQLRSLYREAQQDFRGVKGLQRGARTREVARWDCQPIGGGDRCTIRQLDGGEVVYSVVFEGADYTFARDMASSMERCFAQARVERFRDEHGTGFFFDLDDEGSRRRIGYSVDWIKADRSIRSGPSVSFSVRSKPGR
jgi:hypothetical protein